MYFGCTTSLLLFFLPDSQDLQVVRNSQLRGRLLADVARRLPPSTGSALHCAGRWARRDARAAPPPTALLAAPHRFLLAAMSDASEAGPVRPSQSSLERRRIALAYSSCRGRKRKVRHLTGRGDSCKPAHRCLPSVTVLNLCAPAVPG